MRHSNIRVNRSFSPPSAVAAQAQEKRVYSFGGGYPANAEVSDRWAVVTTSLRRQANASPVIEGMRYNGLGDKRLSVPLFPTPNPGASTPSDFSADMNMQYGTASLIVQRPNGGVRPYGLVGMGVYYRPIHVTTPGVGWVPGYCDPWWYVCYPGGWVETTNIVGERSSTDFGMSFGGGVNFGVVYAELRYNYIWGPEVSVSNSNLPGVSVETDTRKANGQFLQTTFGIRFCERRAEPDL